MTPQCEQVLTKVTEIVRGVLNNDSVQLTYETTANSVDGWDSLNHIEIIVGIERHFKIKFNFVELQKFKNVGEMCENIAKRLA